MGASSRGIIKTTLKITHLLFSTYDGRGFVTGPFYMRGDTNVENRFGGDAKLRFAGFMVLLISVDTALYLWAKPRLRIRALW
jgi:hypothetical protein